MRRFLKYAYWAITLQLSGRLRQQRVISRIRSGGLFDEEYYALWNPELETSSTDLITHYVFHGAAEGRDPHPLFSTQHYLTKHSTALRVEENPLDHFLRVGYGEGLSPHPNLDAESSALEGIEIPVGSPNELFAFADDSALLEAELEKQNRYAGFTHLDDFVQLTVDSCVLISGSKVFLTGWLVDPQSAICTLRLCCGAAASDNILPIATRYDRRDVALALEHKSFKDGLRGVGFSVLLDLPNENSPAQEIRLIGQMANGQTFMIGVPNVLRDQNTRQLADRFFAEFSVDHSGVRPRLGAVGRALQSCIALKEPSKHTAGNGASKTYGTAVDNPEVSIIVQLDEHLDSVEYQLSQFASDPDFCRSELVYVMSESHNVDSARRKCEDWYGIFRVPFRLESRDGRPSIAESSNVIIRSARAKLVLLLGAKVIPRASGWLSELCRVYASLEDPGPVAPLLTQQDGSVECCGVEFETHPGMSGLWLHARPLQGLPTELAGLPQQPRVVASVSGECMMISRSRYLELSGLDEGYLGQGVVVSDLCMKAYANGFRSYLVPTVSLYSLGGEATTWRSGSEDKEGFFDCWQFSTRWDASIREVMSHSRISLES